MHTECCCRCCCSASLCCNTAAVAAAVAAAAVLCYCVFYVRLRWCACALLFFSFFFLACTKYILPLRSRVVGTFPVLCPRTGFFGDGWEHQQQVRCAPWYIPVIVYYLVLQYIIVMILACCLFQRLWVTWLSLSVTNTIDIDNTYTCSTWYTSIYHDTAYHTVKVPVVVVALTLTHRYNAVRGHRTSREAPIPLQRKITSGGKQIKTEDNTHNSWNKS